MRRRLEFGSVYFLMLFLERETRERGDLCDVMSELHYSEDCSKAPDFYFSPSQAQVEELHNLLEFGWVLEWFAPASSL